MTEEAWAAVDRHLGDRLVGADADLDAALEAAAAAGLPAIQVAPLQGKLLHVLARAVRARRILEIGTLGGYSTIWLARALPPGGRLVTLELDPRHAEVARGNVRRSGLEAAVELRLGAALEILPALEAEGAGPFDLSFIDADKAAIPEYVAAAHRLSRPGSLIVVDNVVRGGRVLDDAADDADLRGVRRLPELLAGTPGLVATAIQTVGEKGWDGFALALVTEVPARPAIPGS